MKYQGYYKIEELPFKQGQTVTLPKGTVVESPFTSVKSRVLKRAQTVKIHHLLPGCEVSENAFDHAGYNVPKVIVEKPSPVNSDVMEKVCVLSNPKIVWPGSGGYWQEVDINSLV